MTAAARRPELHLVTDTDTDTDETSFETYDGWHAETVLAQWEPENQLIGSLMWLTATQAAPILQAVDDHCLKVFTHYPKTTDLLPLVSAYLEQVGVKMEIQPMEYAAFLSAMTTRPRALRYSTGKCGCSRAAM